jgi:hypothetical protein
MNTTQMASYIAKGLGKKLYLSRLLGFGVWLLLPFLKPAQKAFGSLTYEQEEIPLTLLSNEESVTASA